MRLDEKTARTLARGRLRTFQEEIDEVLQSDWGASRKPSAMAKLFASKMNDAFGDGLFLLSKLGSRSLFSLVAYPSEPAGWIDVMSIHFQLRSETIDHNLFVRISAHAIARLMERRGGVDPIVLLGEELRENGTIHAVIKSLAVAHELGQEELKLKTVNGEFRGKRDDANRQTVVMLTWVPT